MSGLNLDFGVVNTSSVTWACVLPVPNSDSSPSPICVLKPRVAGIRMQEREAPCMRNRSYIWNLSNLQRQDNSKFATTPNKIFERASPFRPLQEKLFPDWNSILYKSLVFDVVRNNNNLYLESVRSQKTKMERVNIFPPLYSHHLRVFQTN